MVENFFRYNFALFATFFTIDLDVTFTMTIPNKAHVVFGCVVAAPLVLAGLYVLAARIRSEAWIRAYSEDWGATKWRAGLIWVIVAVRLLGH